MTHGISDFTKAIEGIRTKLKDPCIYENVNAHQDKLMDILAQLENGVESADRPLRILFVGGTGVGKSTLLNALAEGKIAKTSVQRPCTCGFTAYIHQDDDDTWLGTRQDINVCRHNQETLRNKIIIDAPDADSAETANRETLRTALELADLAVVVTSPEKYASLSVENLIKNYNIGRHFAFVMNKMDASDTTKSAQDYRHLLDKDGFEKEPLFMLSAKNAFELAVNGNVAADKTGEFDALKDYIGEKMTDVKVQQIKEINISKRFEWFTDTLKQILPDNYESMPDQWMQAWQEELNQYLEKIQNIVCKSVLDETSVHSVIVQKKTADIRGPYGFFSNIVYGMKRVFQGKLIGSGRTITSKMINKKLDKTYRNALTAKAGRMQDEWIYKAGQLGLDKQMVKTTIQETATGQPDDDSLVEQFVDTIAESTRKQLENRIRPIRMGGQILMNIPAVLWIVYWMSMIAAPVLRWKPPAIHYAPGAFVMLICLMGVQWYMIDRYMRRRAWSDVDRVRKGVADDISQRYRDDLSKGPERVGDLIMSFNTWCRDTVESGTITE
jgi:GTPase Era involved in 16S rRNA processing